MKPMTVMADWHAILVLAARFSPPTNLPDNGLVRTTGDGEATVYTGVWGGDVNVTCELLGEEPELNDADWEVVVEFSAAVDADRPLQVVSRVEESANPPIASEPGTYRVRLSARGRDVAFDKIGYGTEGYLLQTWPAPDGPLRVLRVADRTGQGLRPPP